MIAVAFIVGSSRSGTSVLSEALGRSPNIVATEELHYYNLLKPAAEAAGDGSSLLLARLKAVQEEGRFFEVKNGKVADLPEVAADELPADGGALLPAFFKSLAQACGARAVVEQTPMNLYYRDEIRHDFPKALFFLMRRDPRAILASQKNRWKVGEYGRRHIPERDIRRVRHAGHPILQLVVLRKALRAARAAAKEANVVPVAYEELVLAPERVLSDLATRLGVPFVREMLQVSGRGSSHAPEEACRGFDPSRLESWRDGLTQTEIWLAERFCTADLAVPATGARPRAGELLRLVLTLPRDLVLALYYSAGGYGNLVDSVKRRFL